MGTEPIREESARAHRVPDTDVSTGSRDESRDTGGPGRGLDLDDLRRVGGEVRSERRLGTEALADLLLCGERQAFQISEPGDLLAWDADQFALIEGRAGIQVV